MVGPGNPCPGEEHMRKRRRRLVPVLVSLAVAGLLSILPGTALAASGSSTPDATSRSAPLGGQVPGLTGAAAQQDAGEAADRFRDLTTERVRRAAAAAAPAAAAPA